LAVPLHFDAAGDIVAASGQDRPRAVGKGAVANVTEACATQRRCRI
jgi:hypothetical protein